MYDLIHWLVKPSFINLWNQQTRNLSYYQNRVQMISMESNLCSIGISKICFYLEFQSIDKEQFVAVEEHLQHSS